MNHNKVKQKKSFLTLLVLIVLLFVLCAVFSKTFTKQQNYREVISNVNTKNLLKNLVCDDICYVIGHKSPDTDTVCSAILVADYLKLNGINCEARVSGKLNNETKFVFDNYGLTAPEILDDATDKKIILVDHNEYLQSIDGMKDAEIVGIFDHHGIGNVMTNGPIVAETLNIGSTATIIYRWYKMNDLEINKNTAYYITSAILSDTSNLEATTTTDIDGYALKECAKKAGITNIDEFYEKMQEAALSYDGMTDREILLSDYKEYDMSGVKIGIACVNAVNKNVADEMINKMYNAMQDIYEIQGMKHIFTSIKNYADNETTLIGYGDGVNEILEKAYGTEKVVFNPGVSRKKDIVPKLKETYEAINGIAEIMKNENTNISCEVKCLLDSNIVLNEKKEIDDKYKNIFSIIKKPKNNSVIYIETENQDFNKAGWVNRLRIKDGKDEYNLTYKKRYKIEDEDIDKALMKAKEDGISDIEPEIDWGYNNMTLSYSIETNIPYDGEANILLPEEDVAISYINEYMPEIENNNNWGKNLLNNANITYPVHYKKYSGSFEGHEIDIEVWPLLNKSTGENEYITEISFKSNMEDAKILKTKLNDYLDNFSILLHEDSLKTQKVLDMQ